MPTRPSLNLQTLLLIFRFVSANVSFQVTSRMRRIRTKFVSGMMDNEVSKVLYEDFLPQALAEGHYVAAPEPVVVGKGLDHIQAGFDAQRQGVSAKKVVVSL